MSRSELGMVGIHQCLASLNIGIYCVEVCFPIIQPSFAPAGAMRGGAVAAAIADACRGSQARAVNGQLRISRAVRISELGEILLEEITPG